jgi:uncharacterized membrane protein HdeD (DUF308 family)
MDVRSTKAIRIAKVSYIILSSLFIALGIGLIALRDLSVSLIGITAGVMLIAFGIVKLIGYFSKDLYRLAFQFDLSLGLMLAVLGIIILRNPNQAIAFLCLMLGIATMADGMFKLQSALEARRFGLKSWPLILVLAVGAGIVGILLALHPMQSARLLTVLLGIGMILEGVLNLSTALCGIKIIRNQRADGFEGKVE